MLSSTYKMIVDTYLIGSCFHMWTLLGYKLLRLATSHIESRFSLAPTAFNLLKFTFLTCFWSLLGELAMKTLVNLPPTWLSVFLAETERSVAHLWLRLWSAQVKSRLAIIVLLVDFTLNLVFEVVIYGIDWIDGVSAGFWSCMTWILFESDALLVVFIELILVFFVYECTFWWCKLSVIILCLKFNVSSDYRLRII